MKPNDSLLRAKTSAYFGDNTNSASASRMAVNEEISKTKGILTPRYGLCSIGLLGMGQLIRKAKLQCPACDHFLEIMI